MDRRGHGNQLSPGAQTRVAGDGSAALGFPALQIKRANHARGSVADDSLGGEHSGVSALRQFDGIESCSRPAPMELGIAGLPGPISSDAICVLVGPNATGPGAVAGLRVRFSLWIRRLARLGPIDECWGKISLAKHSRLGRAIVG